MAYSTRYAMPGTRQSGAALVIALVFLLLMTILGVSSMQGTALQERMAGNQRDRNLAFQSAEAAVRATEGWIDQGDNAQCVAAATADDDAELINGRLTAPAGWDGKTPEPIPDEAIGVPTSQLAAHPAVHVGAPLLAAPSQVAVQGNPYIIQYFPITARGVGGSESAVVVLQSYFAIPEKDKPCAPK